MWASLLLAAGLAVSALAALPKGWKACARSSPDYDKCFRSEASNAIRTLIGGDKKLGVLPLDPLRISKLEIPNKPGPVNLNLSFRDLDVSGIAELDLLWVRNDWKTGLEAAAKIPDLYVLGDYKIAGQVLVLPITGAGKCNLTFHDLDVKIKVQWTKVTKGGRQYFQMEKFLLQLIPKRLFLFLENLFNGDKALGENMNVFLNENWEPILAEVSPGITSALSQAFTLISNQILARIPAEEIDKK